MAIAEALSPPGTQTRALEAVARACGYSSWIAARGRAVSDERKRA